MDSRRRESIHRGSPQGGRPDRRRRLLDRGRSSSRITAGVGLPHPDDARVQMARGLDALRQHDLLHGAEQQRGQHRDDHREAANRSNDTKAAGRCRALRTHRGTREPARRTPFGGCPERRLAHKRSADTITSRPS